MKMRLYKALFLFTIVPVQQLRKKFKLIIGILLLLSLLFGYWYIQHCAKLYKKPFVIQKVLRHKALSPGDECSSSQTYIKNDFKGWMENHSSKVDNKVLLLAESSFSHEAVHIINTLESWRIRVKMLSSDKSIPPLTHKGRAKYSAIIFQKIKRYFSMDSWNKKLLETYCKSFGVGIILFSSGNDSLDSGNYSLQSLIVPTVYDYRLVKNPLLRISKHGAKINNVPGKSWRIFTNKSLTPVATVQVTSNGKDSSMTVAALQEENVKKLFIGNTFSSLWLHRLLLMDGLCYLSANRSLCTTLKRYVLIDVDDIFVGKLGSRLTEDDVEAMLHTQEAWSRQYVEGFKFNLGFSAYWYKEQGNKEEIKGDQLLVKLKG